MKCCAKMIVCVTLFSLMSTCLYGCQREPSEKSVTSKNDGSFDSSVIQPGPQDQMIGSTQAIIFEDEFSSTDGSVNFALSIQNQFTVNENPVVEVVPHYLTGEDAEKIAVALLSDAEWYEQEPLLEPNYSKEQIQEKINRWSQYANSQAVSELCGTGHGDTVDIIKSFIETYTGLYESAPNEKSQALCQWNLKKDSYYYYSEESLTGQNLSSENDAIKAVAKLGNVEYTLEIFTRNMSDYKINNIYLSLGEGISPDFIDADIYRAMLCRTDKPTDEDIIAVEAKAQEILDSMDLGDWKVDASSVQTTYYGETPEYIINVSAVPVINGISAIRRPQFGNLKSDSSYASNYYLSDVNFQFSANGDLVSFSMYSPIDVKEVLNENVATTSLDELMELAKNHLMLSDYYEYGLSADALETMEETYGEDFICKINLCQMDYGMLRVKVPNTDESYYYVPGIVIAGTIDYVGKDTGNVYASSGEAIYYDRIVPLVSLNAVDGSIIELSNE